MIFKIIIFFTIVFFSILILTKQTMAKKFHTIYKDTKTSDLDKLRKGNFPDKIGISIYSSLNAFKTKKIEDISLNYGYLTIKADKNNVGDVWLASEHIISMPPPGGSVGGFPIGARIFPIGPGESYTIAISNLNDLYMINNQSVKQKFYTLLVYND